MELKKRTMGDHPGLPGVCPRSGPGSLGLGAALALSVVGLTCPRVASADPFSGASCDLVDNAFTDADLPYTPLYRKGVFGGCYEVDPTASNLLVANYYADATCSEPFDFVRRPAHYEICLDLYRESQTDPQTGEPYEPSYGNAGSWSAESQHFDPLQGAFPSTRWSVARATRFNHALLFDSSANHVPFMKKVAYKTVTTDRGECSLEMRVYRKTAQTASSDEVLTPFMMLHGGSWRSRFPYMAVEAEASFFTERNRVVFAPTYRVAGDEPRYAANHACSGADWQDIVEDAEDALAWVTAHGHLFGAAQAPVELLGQSAGAHLAQWLAYGENHANFSISKVVLQYPPTEMSRLVTDAQAGLVPPEAGSDVLEDFLGEELNQVDPAVLAKHDFPALVEGRNVALDPLPPSFILHGDADDLVFVDHALALCDAQATAQGSSPGSHGQAFTCQSAPGAQHCECGGDSRMHVIDGAVHGFDGTCLGTLTCLGSPGQGMSSATQQTVRESWQAMLDWLDS